MSDGSGERAPKRGPRGTFRIIPGGATDADSPPSPAEAVQVPRGDGDQHPLRLQKPSNAEQHDTVEIGPGLLDAPREQSDESGARTNPRSADEAPAGVRRLPPALRFGARYGDFIAGERLARGGFAEVYEASHARTGAKVALKVLNVMHAADPLSVARFVQEGELWEALRGEVGFLAWAEMFKHPEVGYVLAMERLLGQTLREYVAQLGRLDPLVSLKIVKELLLALAVVHRHAYVHRDVKPDNVMIEPRQPGLPKERALATARSVLLDLGLAKGDDGPTTTSSSVAGSVAYMAPEQIEQAKVCPATDIYSVGLMLYEMLEGERAYEYKKREHLAELPPGSEVPARVEVQSHLYAQVKIPEVIAVSLWNRVIVRCLHKEAKDRFQTALELVRAIEAWERDFLGGRLTRADLLPALDAGDDAEPAPPPLGRDPNRVVDRRPEEIPLESRCRAPSLVVVGGPPGLVGKRYAIGRELSIGRLMPHEDATRNVADLTFAVDTMSVKHCRLEISAEAGGKGVYLVSDLGSVNRTVIEGVSIATGFLKPGMVMRLGGLSLRLFPPGRARPEDLAPPEDERAEPQRGRTKREVDPVKVAAASPAKPSAPAPTPAIEAESEAEVPARPLRVWLWIVPSILAPIALFFLARWSLAGDTTASAPTTSAADSAPAAPATTEAVATTPMSSASGAPSLGAPSASQPPPSAGQASLAPSSVAAPRVDPRAFTAQSSTAAAPSATAPSTSWGKPKWVSSDATSSPPPASSGKFKPWNGNEL